MRVVLASHRYPPATGGSERFAQIVAEGIARRGVQTSVVTSAEPGTPARETVGGVDVTRLAMTRAAGIRWPHRYLATLRELRPDLLHLSGNRIWCVDFYLPRAAHRPWRQMITGHGFYQYEMHRRWWDRWYFERYLPRRLSSFDAYAAQSARERDQLAGWGFDRERIRIVPSAIDPEEFAHPPSRAQELRASWGLDTPYVAVYAGGFFENKRVDRLVEAAAAARGPWSLVLVGADRPGSPYARAYVEELAHRRGVPIRVLGSIPRTEVITAIAAADALVLGSSYEGFGLTMLEAMAAGKPFVSFRTGAAPELAATGSGYCVDSIEEFSGALTELTDPCVREGMGARGRAEVPQWSSERMVDRYLALYESILASPRRS